MVESETDYPFEIREDPSVQHWKWRRFLFYTRKQVSSYYPAPDDDVFNWDGTLIEKVKNYSVKGTPSIMRRQARRRYKADVQTKKSMIMARQAKEYLLARGNNEAASALQGAALAQIPTVIAVEQRYDKRGNVITNACLTVTSLSVLFVPFLVSSWVNSHRGWWSLLLYCLEGFVVGVMFFFAATRSGISWRTWLSGIILVTAIASSVFVAARYHNRNPGLLWELGAGIGVMTLLSLVNVAILMALLNMAAYRGQHTEPEAVLLTDLVLLVAIAMEWEAVEPNRLYEREELTWPLTMLKRRQGTKWMWIDKRRELIRKLEVAARRAERVFAYAAVKNESPWLRQWSIDRGRRVAAVIRQHEQRALEVSIGQRALIGTSLLNGLVYLLKRDWDSLLVANPGQPVKSLVRRYAPRVALTILLVVLAFLLPALLPTVITDPASFKATVLITAGFSLLAPDVQKAADAIKSFRQ